MKNRFLLLAVAALALSSTAFGDIQSPHGHHFNWSRKLSRGIGNMAFGPFEAFSVWRKTNASDGSIAAFTDFFVEGTKRTAVRFCYGLYETVTFAVPSWKLTYRPPYYRKEVVDNWWGYTQFPPEMGFRSDSPYSRTQGW